jgi:hypothetical protein
LIIAKIKREAIPIAAANISDQVGTSEALADAVSPVLDDLGQARSPISPGGFCEDHNASPECDLTMPDQHWRKPPRPNSKRAQLIGLLKQPRAAADLGAWCGGEAAVVGRPRRRRRACSREFPRSRREP